MANPRTDPELSLRWMREGTGFVVGLVDKLTDAQLREPSGLPGWTRAHVVAHLARNAEGIGRLARWARTGVETPMYPSAQQRNLDIELSVRADPATLRAGLTDTAAATAREISLLDERAWAAGIRNAQGLDMPATVIPWMRAREVWLHGVDLDAGSGLADLPAGLLDDLLRDVAIDMAAKRGCPAATLAPTDRTDTVPLGAGGSVVVAGAAADLLAWLIGRPGAGPLTASGPDGVPEMPRWL